MGENENQWDESLLEGLPPRAQSRLIRVGRDLIEAQVCRQYGLEPGSLVDELPDPISKNLGPQEFREAAERAALSGTPLKGKTPAELLRLWQKQKEEDGAR